MSTYIDNHPGNDDMAPLSALYERLGPFDPVTPEQVAKARVTVAEAAPAGGWDVVPVLEALGIGGDE